MAKKSIFKRAMSAIFNSQQDAQPEADYVYNPSGLDPQMKALVNKVRDFSRWPLHQMTAEERKKESDFVSELKAWVKKLSPNDRAIVMQRQPWEIANHVMGIVPIDGVVAIGRAASYERAPKPTPTFGKRGLEQEFVPSTRAANENIPAAPKAETAFQARGLAAMQQELREQGMQNGPKRGRNMEPTYEYNAPKPPASILYANAI